MEDTSPEVRKIHLEIWLSKPPEERLLLTLKNSEDFYAIINELKRGYKECYPDQHIVPFPEFNIPDNKGDKIPAVETSTSERPEV